MSNYFPIGFDRDPAHPEADIILSRLEDRMEWLNRCHDKSGLEGHIFAAALCSYAAKIPQITVEWSQHPTVWELLMFRFDDVEIGNLAASLSCTVADTPPRMEFPNAIALVDCRFVTTEEWEFLRRYSIGGSEVAAIIGKSHYSSPLQLYHDKRGDIPKAEDNSKQYMFDFGHCVEDSVIKKTCSLLGCTHYPEYRMFRHKRYSYITCNPDGILLFPDGQLALFEAKTCTRHKKDEWDEGIPDYYAPQPQQYLEVLDDPRLTKGYIGVVFGGLPSNFKAHRYLRDTAMAADQVRQIEQFWTNNFLPEKEPAVTGNAELDLKAVYCRGQTPAAQKVTLPESTIDDFVNYFEMKNQRKKLDAELNKTKAKEAQVLQSILKQYPPDIPLLFKKENGPTYKVRQTVTRNDTLDLSVIPEAIQAAVLDAAARTVSPGNSYTNPKLSFHEDS